MSTRLIEVVIGASPPPRLDKALARDVPEAAALSRTRLARLIGDGAVSRRGETLTDPKARVVEGDVISVAVAVVEATHLLPEALPLDIVFEDEHVVVVNKAVGMVVHPAPGSPSGTLVNALMAHCGETLSGIGGEKRPGIVHRIDKDTSGLLVVAKTDEAHHSLADQFAAHTVQRRYAAVVYGVPNTGDPRLRGVRGVSVEGGDIKITTHLARHKTDRQRQAVLFEGGRHAVTRVALAEQFGTPPVAARITCRLETGRTHQIRVHMAHIGHGLIGDPVYGGRRRLSKKAISAEAAAMASEFPRQALHAAELGFIHPISKAALHFEAPLPDDMATLCAVLRA